MDKEFHRNTGPRMKPAVARGESLLEPEPTRSLHLSARADEPQQPDAEWESVSEDVGPRRDAWSESGYERTIPVAEAPGEALLSSAAEKEAEIRELRELQGQTDAHLQGALQTIRDIRSSFSYRLGKTLTWPARFVYDGVVSLRDGLSRLSLAATLLGVALRHPVQAWRMLSVERMRNLYITFVKRPATAPDVVSFYARQFNEPGVSNKILQSISRKSATSAEREPMVTVIVANLNGREHLPELLASLAKQSYRNHEIVFVDNGSTDGSVEFVRETLPGAKVISLEKNYGFAEAVNIGAEVAAGDLYCLLNNDTRVAADWLEKLVTSVCRSPSIGAVCSKILFWEKFAPLELEIAGTLSGRGRALLDLTRLDESLSLYRKRFIGSGWGEDVRTDGRTLKEIAQKAQLFLPVFKGQTNVSLRIKNEYAEPIRVLVRSRALVREADLAIPASQEGEITLDFAQACGGPELHYLINNAGSDVDEHGNVRDVGFGAVDEGQFDAERVVTAVCGGAVLVRKQALQGLPVFAGHFFAYFEDTDLSLRLRKAGYHLVYCPESIVYHKHASTSEEYSPFFRYYVARNRLLFLALHYPAGYWRAELEQAILNLNHLRQYYRDNPCSAAEKEFAERIPALLRDWDRLISKTSSEIFYQRENYFPRFAVYDNFWNTLGGGEHHACVLADALQRFGPVDFVSEQDFSLRQLEDQFGIDLKYCRKALVSAPQIHHDSAITASYDVFVNSTYGSDLISHCANSYYIVSFPNRPLGQQTGAANYAASYRRFLCNSKYTAGWLESWWGIKGDVLHPSIALANVESNLRDKKNLILNVGRFFREGHNKKQLELVQAFRILIDTGRLGPGWRLALVGQVHEDQKDYLHEVQQEADGYPVEIYNDAKLEDLQALYDAAAVYWHATGLNEDCNANPELYEHFGITTVEAMSYGCIPIVINAGGQPETVSHGKNGYLFSDEEELLEYTALCSRLKEREPEKFAAIAKCARDTAKTFSREGLEQRFVSLLRADGINLVRNARIY